MVSISSKFTRFESLAFMPVDRPMYDSYGPALARAVYDAYFPEETEAIKETPSASSSIDKDEYHSRPAFNYTEESGKKAVTISPPPIWSTLGGKTKPREGEPPTVIKYLPSLIPRTVVRSELDVFGKAVFDEIFGSPLNGVSLAHVVDEFARNLRENHKAPPSRWATFVHIGI